MTVGTFQAAPFTLFFVHKKRLHTSRCQKQIIRSFGRAITANPRGYAAAVLFAPGHNKSPSATMGNLSRLLRMIFNF